MSLPPNTVRLKPANPDLIVRDPVTAQRLAKTGEAKPLNAYWRRRLRDGDVVKVANKKEA